MAVDLRTVRRAFLGLDSRDDGAPDGSSNRKGSRQELALTLFAARQQYVCNRDRTHWMVDHSKCR